MSDLQDAIDNAQSNDLYIPLPILDAARRVVNAVPVYMTSRLSREYTITDDPTQADAWLIDPPEETDA